MKQALSIAALGGIAWAVTAFTTFAALVAVAWIVNVSGADGGIGSKGALTLAWLSLIMPLIVGATVFTTALAWLRGRWPANATARALFAGLCCGASLYLYGRGVTTFNHCELDVSVPFWWLKPCR